MTDALSNPSTQPTRTPNVQLQQAHVQSQRLADNLRADIKNAATRAEHIRLTRHALEAQQLADAIKNGYTETDV
jgi:hypothetical protein